ncbi:zinc finger A20 and AN1 domain-containing stress-associated protein 9-like [Curcuma longa]|uniref:zinc finger A20 and AN1 domain-containing stress-associated protein 9-like n=1 Tax=Curcuma longa TaxID=136217 RepID=UPI003D9F97A9
MAQESWKKDTEQTDCETPEVPILCANKCGFFGTAMNNNLCSKCYKDIAMKHKSMVSSPITQVEKPKIVPSSSVQINHTEGSSKVDGQSEPKVVDDQLKGLLKKQPANRCAQCQKKIGLLGFTCRCGGAFCSSHRYSEAHECSIDYKAAGRVVLAKENPVVMAKKLEKI